MIIQRQQTPNPNALKFVLPEKIFPQSMNFPSAETASSNALATKLFALGDIYNVFMAQDFITVNKYPQANWEPLATQIESIIQENLL
ncbi:MAG: NifU N-terminal domain-containing protein [Caldilineaceae bacterium]